MTKAGRTLVRFRWTPYESSSPHAFATLPSQPRYQDGSVAAATPSERYSTGRRVRNLPTTAAWHQFVAVARIASSARHETDRHLRCLLLCPDAPALPGLHGRSTGSSRRRGVAGVKRWLPVPAAEAALACGGKSSGHAAAERRRRSSSSSDRGEPRRRREPEEEDAEQVEPEAELARAEEGFRGAFQI